MTTEITTTAIAQWFGSNRMLASEVGRQLGKLDWCCVPFCGGCCELPHIQARAGVASDLHRHVINLARVVRDPLTKDELVRMADSMLFHPDELAAAQDRCIRRERASSPGLFARESFEEANLIGWACDYLVSVWMTRGGMAGRSNEFAQSMSFRWTSSGGDSAKRYRSIVESLDGWSIALRPWSFSVADAFEILPNVRDERGHGVYVDAPWPEAGNEYACRFTVGRQKALAAALSRFKETRVVVRYGDHPLIRELYPASRWTWIEQTSRTAGNNDLAEALIVNGPAT